MTTMQGMLNQQRFDELYAKNYESIERYMLEPGYAIAIEGGYQSSDFSYTGQLHNIVQADIVLATANSAIPVLDAVRGSAAALGIQHPPLGYIRADFDTSREYFLEDNDRTLEEEALRLKPIVAGAQSVAVIEEFTAEGKTLKFAEAILKHCNVQTFVPIAGRWYLQAYKEDVDLPGLTSVHAPKMREIGQKAVTRALNGAI